MRFVLVCTIQACTEVADQRDLFPGLGIAVKLVYLGGGSPKAGLSVRRELGLSLTSTGC